MTICCHVMAHESFEDDEIAAYLNEHFVPVKVDREERPDVDAVYMNAVQAMSGRGGWPMSVFLTPDGRPFFGGTYWPKDDRQGMPGFRRVLTSVVDAWQDRRDELEGSAERLTEAIRERSTGSGAASEVDLTLTNAAARAAIRAWDRDHGGFGSAPKFPQAMVLEWLLDRHARRFPNDPGRDAGREGAGAGEAQELACVVHCLDAMARGGVYDQAGGGFHRYSTDERWFAPHFEKMLYDNALLAPVYAKAAALTGRPDFDRVARATLDYLLREMRDDAGGFYSATDADSEGEEGRFFVWTRDEFVDVVVDAAADPDLMADFFGVTERGNWHDPHAHDERVDGAGRNILHVPTPLEEFCDEHDLDTGTFAKQVEEVRTALHARRQGRVRPGLDDKILTSWNALLVRALAVSGMHLGLPEYVAAATETAAFLHDEVIVDGQLQHVWKDGEAHVPAFLEDVSYLAVACLDLYAATGDVRWFESATRWANDALDRFHDDDGGRFFSTAHDAEELFSRPKDAWDNATPAGNSVMLEVAARLGAYTGEQRWRDLADELVRAFQGDATRAPTGFGWYLRAVEGLRVGPREVAVVGRPGQARELLVRELWRRPLTGTVIAVDAPDGPGADSVPLLEGRGEVDGEPAAYVCRDFTCARPVTETSELRALLDATA